MHWFSALIARANENAALTTLLGGQKNYPEQAPQTATRPYVTFLDVTELRPQTLKGWDLEAARVQVDVWAPTYALKNTIMEAVLSVLIPGGTFNGHKFQRAEVALGPRDIAGERDGTTPVFRKTADLIIHHTPA
jgi:hypothetical protein